MTNGGLCVRRILESENFVVTDESADNLWLEVKEYFQRCDQDILSGIAGGHNELSVSDYTYQEDVREIEIADSGHLDTFTRSLLKDGIAKVVGDTFWPSNGCLEPARKEASNYIASGLADRNIFQGEGNE